MTQKRGAQQKLVNRIRRIRGQVEGIERMLAAGDLGADVLMFLAAARGGINSLMAETLEDHIRLLLFAKQRNPASSAELAGSLIDLVRTYLK